MYERISSVRFEQPALGRQRRPDHYSKADCKAGGEVAEKRHGNG
jgi:hypothetical protein